MISIIHLYLFKQIIRNVFLATVCLVLLFLVFDFFDRIDNILPKNPDILTTIKYFAYKIPQFIVLTLPIAITTGTLFAYGVLSKNSEITAMRASGLKLSYLSIPLVILAFFLSILNLFLSETIVPSSTRTVKEIYNIDIQERDKKGAYSQKDFWWRTGNQFYSIEFFDSRTSNLLNFSMFEVDRNFEVKRRIDSAEVQWVNPVLGWQMDKVIDYKFNKDSSFQINKLQSLPLPISEQPRDFYDVETEPLSMTYRQLKNFIEKQKGYGQNVQGLLADLHSKLSFPFVVFICAIAVLPFAIKPARTGSMALSFIAGICICFAYYTVYSFSLALGRAELVSPLLSAWTANIILGVIGIVLFLGTEAPD